MLTEQTVNGRKRRIPRVAADRLFEPLTIAKALVRTISASLCLRRMSRRSEPGGERVVEPRVGTLSHNGVWLSDKLLPGYLSGWPARAGSRRTRPSHARGFAAHPG